MATARRSGWIDFLGDSGAWVTDIECAYATSEKRTRICLRSGRDFSVDEPYADVVTAIDAAKTYLA